MVWQCDEALKATALTLVTRLRIAVAGAQRLIRNKAYDPRVVKGGAANLANARSCQ